MLGVIGDGALMLALAAGGVEKFVYAHEFFSDRNRVDLDMAHVNRLLRGMVTSYTWGCCSLQ